jgi:hypothetical protein
MIPPRFSYVGDDGKPDGDEEIAVIAEHYNEFVELLDDGEGYEALLEMKRRIKAHIDELEKEVDRHRSRFIFCQDLVDGIESRIRRIAESESKGAEDLEQVREDVLERPLGKHWGTHGNTPWNVPRTDRVTPRNSPSADGSAPREAPKLMKGLIGDRSSGQKGPPWNGPHAKGWSLYEEENTGGRNALDPDEEEGKNQQTTSEKSDVLITYTPVSGNLDREYKEEHIERFDQLVFRGDETWREVLNLAKRRFRVREDDYEERRRTLEVLRFRLTTVKTVLYRFEAFGSVEQMDRDEASRHAKRGMPNIFEGRPTLRQHAERIVEKYRSDPGNLPVTMSNLKAWIGHEGENAVTQLQARIREAGLSNWYADGDPDSFCSLVERLYDAGFGVHEGP